MSLFNELQNLMISYRFKPNKKIAQHFVVNPALVQQLVGLAELKRQDIVLEIGAGTGFLTRELLKKCRVVAVELDEKLCQLLAQRLPKKGLHLVRGSFLEVELPKFNKVVSLPPYFHSKAIMLKLFEYDFELAVLVFQKAFAEKVIALPGFKEYNPLSVLAQYGFEGKIVGTVPSSYFFPRPKNDSCILVLKAHKQFGPVADRPKFSLFVKTLFRFQNKNLKNALLKGMPFLLPSLKVSEEVFREKMRSAPLLAKKVNLLTVPEFVEVFNHLA